MKVFLKFLAMVLLVVPAQHLLRGLLSGIMGDGYKYAILGFSNTMVLIVSIVLIVISLFLFNITEPFSANKKR